MIVVSVGALGLGRYTFQVPKSAHLIKSGHVNTSHVAPLCRTSWKRCFADVN